MAREIFACAYCAAVNGVPNGLKSELSIAVGSFFYYLGNCSWLRDVFVSLPMHVIGEKRLCRLFYMLGNCYKMGIGVTCKYVHKKALGYSTAREQQEKNKII
ncbi:MAG: hypothetical protein FWC89_06255, partial [Defluviitaleaceae bacterium]|nr:hypothetical protein [Defluviitaleaceae bacterium]